MASIILTAVLYFIFALCFLVFNIMQLNIEVTADMFRAVSYKITKIPWRTSPLSYIEDIQSPEDVYTWLQEVIVKKIYDELPNNGDPDGYCTDTFPCAVMEGGADKEESCAKFLDLGDSNCPHWMGPNQDCCSSCRSDDCEPYKLITDIGHAFIPTKEMDTSAACEEERPSWFSLISRRLAEDDTDDITDDINSTRRLAGVTNGEEESETIPELKGATFCSERIMKERRDGQESQTRFLTTSSYNRVLMGRVTLKRMLLVDNNSSRFRYAYERQPVASRLQAHLQTAYEDIRSFGNTETYEYEMDEGYMGAGGFVFFLNFQASRDVMARQVESLYRNHAFDLHQGSLVLELMVYNGNVQKFMHLSVVFEHDFSGQTSVQVNATPFDLSLYDWESPRVQGRFCLEVLIILFFLFFVKSSAEDMSDDFAGFFSNIMAFLDVLTMTLCFACILMYAMLIFSYAFTHFYFPIPPFSALEDHKKAFKSLEGLSQKMETLASCIAVNVCLIFIRCLSLITEMSPKWGIVINTVGQAKKNLLNFILMFLVLFLAFTFASQFIFGIVLTNHATIGMAFLTCFRMLMGEGRFGDLDRGDSVMSIFFFYIFHLFFIIVLNMLLSIIVFAYNSEVQRLQHLSDDKDPLKRLMVMCLDLIAERFSYLNNIRMAKYLIASGTAGRINYERVNALRDQRANKPKIRNVMYKEEDKEERTQAEDPADDVVLRAEKPHYSDGMMHYFAERVTADGPAEVALSDRDGKFRANDYRLIAVQSGGQDPDYYAFRAQDRWNDKDTSKGGYDRKEENILKDLTPKVTLVFEGKMKMISYECLMMLFFVALVFVLLNRVARIETVYYLQKTIDNSVRAPMWKEFNPERDMTFDSIERFSDVYQWSQVVIAKGLYGCTVGLSPDWIGKGCAATNKLPATREGWKLYGEPTRPMVETPASQGLSYGYVPDASAKVTRISRVKSWNLGVAKNNLVRMTMQRGCFTKNINKRWMKGYPQILIGEMFKPLGCARESCMADVMLRQEREAAEGRSVTQCLDSFGREIEITSTTGNFWGVNYTEKKLGTYRNLGGIALGLGGTRVEAETVLERSERDGVFSGDTMSIVFDFVLYNAHIDLFAYVSAEFSLMPTGRIRRALNVDVFPPFNGLGSTEGNYLALDNFINMILMAVYFVIVFLFFWNFAQDLIRQSMISGELQHFGLAVIKDFFQEDTWNYTDVISVANNFAVVICWLMYVMYGSGGVDVMTKSFALTYEFTDDAGPAIGDSVNDFQEIGDLYSLFLMFAAVNAFFITVRLMKYFVSVQQLRLILTTLSQSMGQIAIMLLMLLMLLLGFVIMFHVQYGVRTDSFSTIGGSFITLFLFMVGYFDIDAMLKNNPYFTMVVFPAYQFVFYFLLTNMFLATILARWKTCRKDAQDLSIGSQITHIKRNLMSRMSKTQERRGPDKKQSLDSKFWQTLSVLQYLARLEDSGQIRAGNKAKKKESSGEGGDAADAVAEEEKKAVENDAQVDRDVLHTKFKKAHMEIASQMCKSAVMASEEEEIKDSGGGVGDLNEAENGAPKEETGKKSKFGMGGKLKGLKVPGKLGPGGEEELTFVIGFIDDEVEAGNVDVIKKTLEDRLEHDGNQAEEIWLDCLLTALEDTGVLDKLRKLFVPPRMIKPKKKEEWEKFYKKKNELEERLDLFLQMMRERTREKHFEYLSQMSSAKQKVLKSQSIVLSDYLNELDKDIEKYKEECQTLEDKYVRMRKHVAPLL